MTVLKSPTRYVHNEDMKDLVQPVEYSRDEIDRGAITSSKAGSRGTFISSMEKIQQKS